MIHMIMDRVVKELNYWKFKNRKTDMAWTYKARNVKDVLGEAQYKYYQARRN